jgi:hypothetical protein
MWKIAIEKRSLVGVAIGAALLAAAPVSLHWSSATAPALSFDRANAQGANTQGTAAQGTNGEYKYPVGRAANDGGMGYNVQSSTFPMDSPAFYMNCQYRTFGNCPHSNESPQ